MIHFRCWFCDKRFYVADGRRGERKVCSCGRRFKVPRRSGGYSRAWTAGEYLIETVAYGLGGAALGFGFGLFVAMRAPWAVQRNLYVVAGCTAVGGLVGGALGEPGIDWVGRRLRDRERVWTHGR